MQFPPLPGRLARLCLGVVAAVVATDAPAVDYFWTGATGSWSSESNWDQGFVPEAEFEEVGVINNGGVATVSGSAADTAGIVLGQAIGQSGSLIIQSGGSLNAVVTAGAAQDVPPDGRVNVSLAGDALLEVHGGGSFSGALLDVNEAGIVRVGTTGAGAASIASTGGLFSDGVIEVQGPGHSFTVAGNATLEGNSRYVPLINASTHSPMVVVGDAVLNGTLRPQVSGYVPTPGDRWDLIDAATITGDFATLDLSAMPLLGTAQIYRTLVADGGNGQVLQLGVDQVLTVQADWSSGAITLMNEGTAPVTIDGYSILSSLGALDPGSFNGFDDQDAGGAGVWQEAAPTAVALNELSPTGSLTIGAGQSYSLGSAFTPTVPAEFGVSPEDLDFQYSTPDGDTASGIVEYLGNRTTNNLRLTVDPATGEAQLKNDSAVTVELEGYTISSNSGSLLSGTWDSLQDQGFSEWEEASPTANTLNELNPIGTLTLTGGASYGLGDLFSTSGDRDLLLEFLLAGDAAPTNGVVVYGEIAAALPGDYNNDGRVDAADYTVWRDGNSPDSTQAGYDLWANNYGLTSASSSVAVPEPAALGVALISLAASLGRRRS